MSQPPLISTNDQTTVEQLANHLPQSLMVIAEPGLDEAGVARYLAKHHQSDILTVNPLPQKNTISTEQIRNLTAILRTYSSVRRVVIINPANAMTESAQNALLKTLEEPNLNTHFLLITTASTDLLPTIQSRCQQLMLHRTTASQDAQLLEKTKLTPQEKRQISFLAAGLPLLITELSHDTTKLAERQAIAADAKHVLEHPSSYSAMKCAMRYTDRSSALQLIDILLRFIHFQLKHAAQPPAMHRLLQKVLEAEKSLLANGNTRLALLKIVL